MTSNGKHRTIEELESERDALRRELTAGRRRVFLAGRAVLVAVVIIAVLGLAGLYLQLRPGP